MNHRVSTKLLSCSTKYDSQFQGALAHRTSADSLMQAMLLGIASLSHKKKAFFWRDLVATFPVLIDYFCNPVDLSQVIAAASPDQACAPQRIERSSEARNALVAAGCTRSRPRQVGPARISCCAVRAARRRSLADVQDVP